MRATKRGGYLLTELAIWAGVVAAVVIPAEAVMVAKHVQTGREITGEIYAFQDAEAAICSAESPWCWARPTAPSPVR